MIAHAAGIELDEITTTWDKWVTPDERKTAKGVIAPGNVAAVRFTINGVYQGETRIQLEHVNRIGEDAAPDWPTGNENDVYRVDIEGTPEHLPGDGVPVHRRLRTRRRGRGLPGHRAARAQRGARRQRPAAGLGDPTGSAADCGSRAQFDDVADGIGLSVGAASLAGGGASAGAAVTRSPVLTRYPHRPPEVGVPSENPNLAERGLIITDFVDRVGDPVPIVAPDGSSHRAEVLLAEALRALLYALTGGRPPAEPVGVTHPAHWRPAAVDALRGALDAMPEFRAPCPRCWSPTPRRRSPRCRTIPACPPAASSRCATSAAPAPASPWPTPPTDSADRSDGPPPRPLRRPRRPGAADPGRRRPLGRRVRSTCPARRRSDRSSRLRGAVPGGQGAAVDVGGHVAAPSTCPGAAPRSGSPAPNSTRRSANRSPGSSTCCRTRCSAAEFARATWSPSRRSAAVRAFRSSHDAVGAPAGAGHHARPGPSWPPRSAAGSRRSAALVPDGATSMAPAAAPRRRRCRSGRRRARPASSTFRALAWSDADDVPEPDAARPDASPTTGYEPLRPAGRRSRSPTSRGRRRGAAERPAVVPHARRRSVAVGAGRGAAGHRGVAAYRTCSRDDESPPRRRRRPPRPRRRRTAPAADAAAAVRRRRPRRHRRRPDADRHRAGAPADR